MKDKRRTVGNILIIIGAVLLLSATGLFLYNVISNNKQAEDSLELTRSAKEKIENDESDLPADSGETDRSGDSEDFSELMPVDIEGYPCDGYLSIPAIDLEMAVLDTWNRDYLRKTICRYYGSPYTHDFVVAGHNYRSSFGKLKSLSQGDDIYFTDMNGRVFHYVVRQTEVLDGTAIDEMLSGGWDLSLYTCTYGGQSRFTVRCEEV